MITIPKKLHHIWIGPKEPPLDWMRTWQEKHPDWEYQLWRNKDLFGRNWRNKHHIEAMYMAKRWAGVADLMRYEILAEEGGFVAPADAICLRPLDDLFDEDHDAYSAYENEIARPGLVMPLLASSENNPFALRLVESLHAISNVDGEPWQVTGNLFMQDAIEAFPYPRLKILPSITFVPEHYTGEKGQGDMPTYATHEWGSHGAYERLKNETTL